MWYVTPPRPPPQYITSRVIFHYFPVSCLDALCTQFVLNVCEVNLLDFVYEYFTHHLVSEVLFLIHVNARYYFYCIRKESGSVRAVVI